MKRLAYVILPLFVIFLACGNQKKENNNRNKDTFADYNEDSNNAEHETEEDEFANSNFDNDKTNQSGNNKSAGFFNKISGEGGLKTHELKDAHTGLTVNSTQYPSNWQVISKPTYTLDQKIPAFLIQIQGPHHLKSFNTPLSVYVSYQNPETYQLMVQYGVPPSIHRPLASNQQIIESEVKARMENSGFHYSGTIQLEKIENYIKQKIREGGSNINSEITFTVWENNQGQKALAMLTKAYVQQELSYIDIQTLWLYGVDYTFVDATHFDETISHLERAMDSTKENPQWQQYVQQLNQQRMAVAQQQHEQRMRNNQASFDAHQQRMKGISAAQDANHAAFMNRNFGAGSDNGQQQIINSINEQETVYNPLTGNNYQVEAGSKEYWMDSNGEYIKNDDLFYTPNGDINLNNREWVKVK